MTVCLTNYVYTVLLSSLLGFTELMPSFPEDQSGAVVLEAMITIPESNFISHRSSQCSRVSYHESVIRMLYPVFFSLRKSLGILWCLENMKEVYLS